MKDKVGIVMGSISDKKTLEPGLEILKQLDIEYELKIVSAHRTPEILFSYAKNAVDSFDVIIAAAGGSAHLPGMIASLTPLPVIGVPVQSKSLNGVDSLLSIVQMPGGVPVATMAIGESGAKNAALFAARIMALNNNNIKNNLNTFINNQTKSVLETEVV
ncbi:5-(carboxyamino)imidazole ribonucleotide mutase [Spiroplasma gladiatoris]|uniref:N5-carboxyaminoimidazole ribonucleotide mutase n=1 Tax=Spiroplasma gladiatoris TaxID=2143 RepID=A0A4P7AHY0_9MOLU|nr:5-(carboxyamino)imidazole ribonucleotide mutase [Spiroplasma gladiatoris]QBQ08054.1 5-(carboxyamino)imidazole ribonucleotide mutase [Spiroplasma gladiatoris]